MSGVDRIFAKQSNLCLNEEVKRILLVFVGLIVLAGASFGLVYKFGGLQEHIRFMNNIDSLVDIDRKAYMEDVFFNGTGDKNGKNVRGGVMGGIGSKGVWLWNKLNRPVFYRFSNETSFIVVRNCSQEKMLEWENGGSKPEPEFDKYKVLGSFIENVNAGMHVFLYLDGGSNVVSIVVNPDVKNTGYAPVFCTMRDNN